MTKFILRSTFSKMMVSMSVRDSTPRASKRQRSTRIYQILSEHRIALSVLGTDYDNYIVGHGMMGLKGESKADEPLVDELLLLIANGSSGIPRVFSVRVTRLTLDITPLSSLFLFNSSPASYWVAFRKIPADAASMAAVTKLLETNKVTKEFDIIDHSSC